MNSNGCKWRAKGQSRWLCRHGRLVLIPTCVMSGSRSAPISSPVMWAVTTTRLVITDTMGQRVVFETSVTIYQLTWRNVSEDLNLFQTS
jgi:hypothetical protein